MSGAMFYVSRLWIPVLSLVWFSLVGPASAESLKVRLLKMDGHYQDNPSADDFNPINLLLGDMERPKSFPELCHQLDTWAKTPDVDDVVLDFASGTAVLNLAQAFELARHVETLRQSGKQTFAWLGNATPIPYLVASACDKILITELSALDFSSLSLTVLHFHDLLQMIGAEASVVRAGDFKGAVEPFTLSEMSPPLRAHYRDMVGTMNDALVARIAQGRKLTAEAVRTAQGTRLFTASQAKAQGLVDEIVPPGQERAAVEKLLAKEVQWVEPPAKQVKSLSFFELMGKLLATSSRPAAKKPSLAVLHLDGQIMASESTLPGILSPAGIDEAVDQLIADEAVRGVVVRINSPGGSASASEAIRRSLERLAKAKPLNFSFGAMAASGGYWVSCIGRPIYSEPTTLTGSIGVFALKLSAGALLHRVGLNLDTVSLDDSATAFSLARGWSPQEQTQIQKLVDDVYGRFVALVSASRPLSPAQLEPLAGGRVWSGSQAVERKLVDHLGGLQEALDALAQKAGLERDYPVLHWPQPKSFLERLELLGGSSQFDSAPWAKSIPAPFRARLPWALLEDSLKDTGPKAWLLLPGALEIH